MKETFGEYIRKLRQDNGFTLTQLAAKLNLDSANLSKIENGKRDFDEKRLSKLAEVFSLDIKLLKEELLSDIIAKKIYNNKCSLNTLLLAEEKVKYLKYKQLQLNFDKENPCLELWTDYKQRTQQKKKTDLNLVSLFTGGGGLDIGFHEAGYNIIFASDIMPQAELTFKHNFKNIPFIKKDITLFTKEEILNLTLMFR